MYIRLLAKLTFGRELKGGSGGEECRTGVYTKVREGSFPEPACKSPAEAGLGKKSIV